MSRANVLTVVSSPRYWAASRFQRRRRAPTAVIAASVSHGPPLALKGFEPRPRAGRQRGAPPRSPWRAAAAGRSAGRRRWPVGRAHRLGEPTESSHHADRRPLPPGATPWLDKG